VPRMAIGFPVVGAAIARQQPRHPIAWIFLHWFTARCTFSACLPDPGRRAVPTRPVVVRAADGTTIPAVGSPLGTLGLLVPRGLTGDSVPGGRPWRPDAHKGVVPRGLVHQHGAAPPSARSSIKGGTVLGVGIDWAEDFHLVALGRPGEGVLEVSRVEHAPDAVDALVARIVALEPDPAEVRVVLETRHGLLVERLVDAGFTVLPVNPDLVARRRGPARKKDDAEDARIACLLALDRFASLRPLVPHGELAGELRAIARDDERARRDERRLLNRLRADLIATFPAALAIAGDRLDAPTVLRLLERWPTASALASASQEELVTFARSAHHGWPERVADQVAAALATSRFTPKDYLVRAKADTIRLTASQLLAIGAQRRAWERRMGQLLLGAPRRGRAKQPQQQELGQAFPGGEIYLSFAGLGDRLAARIAGEIGDHPQQFSSPNALQCYAGRAPVTRRSGKHELVVASRQACNRFLADAVQQWAFAASPSQAGRGSSTTSRSPGARATTPRCERSATGGWRSCGTA
jgi:transposase